MKVLILIIALLFPGVAFAQIAFPGGWTAAWETIPADTDPISDGAGEIRDHKEAISARLEANHCFGADPTCGVLDTGLHRMGSANLLVSADCPAELIGDHEDGWACVDTGGTDMGLWVYYAAAWHRADGVPTGSIIIFDHIDTCPAGYIEYAEYEGVTLRGRDLIGVDDVNIPDNANVTCTGDGGVEVGLGGCGPLVEAGRYADDIEITQMPVHDHDLVVNIGAGVVAYVDGGIGNVHDDPAYINDTGGGEEHYHPFRTVLFCEKL